MSRMSSTNECKHAYENELRHNTKHDDNDDPNKSFPIDFENDHRVVFEQGFKHDSKLSNMRPALISNVFFKVRPRASLDMIPIMYEHIFQTESKHDFKHDVGEEFDDDFEHDLKR